MSGTWSRRRRSVQASSVPPSMARSSTAVLVSSSSKYSNSNSAGPSSNKPILCSAEHYSIFGQDGPVPMSPVLQYQYSLLCRSTEKMFEEAEQSGVLSLAGRKLKEFPTSLVHKYDVADIVAVDLSNNRLPEIPGDVCELRSLESLRAKNNCIKRIPSDITLLDSLNYLDLSNNLLTNLPLPLFELPLELLLVAGNRLESIPREIRSLSSTLTELDLSHNMLTSIPADIALLKMLRVLLLRKNLLDQFPSELCRLSLHTLDLSSNQFVHLPLHIRKMKTLVEFFIQDNPLQSPPASIVNKGREHIFKWMDVAAGGAQPSHNFPSRQHHSSSTLRALNIGRSVIVSCDDRDITRKSSAPAPIERRTRSSRFHTVGGSDSGYASTADEHRLSHELVPTSLDDITEYAVYSPSPDEGIQVQEEASCSTAESVSLNSQSSSSDGKITMKPTVILEEPRTVRIVEPEKITASPLKPMIKASVPPLAKPEEDLAVTPKKTLTTDVISNGAPVTPIVVKNRTSATKERTAPAPVKKQPSSDSTASSSGCSVTPQTSTSNASPTPASLDVCNNNTPNAKEKVSTPRPSVPPPGVPTASVKPISKVAPLVNTSASKQSPPNIAPTKIIKPATSISKLTPPSSRPSGSPPVKTPVTGKSTVNGASATKKAIPSSGTSSASSTASRSRVPSTQSSISSIRHAASAASIPRSVRSTDSSKASTPSSTASLASDKNGNTTRPTTTTPSSTAPNKSATTAERVSMSNSNSLEGFRKIFKDKIGLTLPNSRDSISNQLSDGIHLCGLVNALKQRQYISPVATSTDSNPITPMKARRNVEAFITACKRNAVPESQMCTVADIVGRRNLTSVMKTVHCLVKNIPAKSASLATSTSTASTPVKPSALADSRVVSHV